MPRASSKKAAKANKKKAATAIPPCPDEMLDKRDDFYREFTKREVGHKLMWFRDCRGILHILPMERDFDVSDDEVEHVKWKLTDDDKIIVQCPPIIKDEDGNVMVPNNLIALAVLQKAFPNEYIMANTINYEEKNGVTWANMFFVMSKTIHFKMTREFEEGKNLLTVVSDFCHMSPDFVTTINGIRMIEDLEPLSDPLAKAPQEEITMSVCSAFIEYGKSDTRASIAARDEVTMLNEPGDMLDIHHMYHHCKSLAEKASGC